MALKVNLPTNLIPKRNPASLDPSSKTNHEPSLALPIKKSELLETSDKIKTDINIHDLWTVVREYKSTLLKATTQPKMSATSVLPYVTAKTHTHVLTS